MCAASRLTLTAVPLEVLYSARLAAAPPDHSYRYGRKLYVPGNGGESAQPYAGSSLFQIGSYNVSIYPGASYSISGNIENPPIQRPFPADPGAVGSVSRFALGATAWLDAFPSVSNTPLSITPRPASSFSAGVSVQISIGNGPAYTTVPASRLADGSWTASLTVALNTTTSIVLIPVAGAEPKPYDWIDTSRYFTPAAPNSPLYTTEGVYGVTSRGPTQFAEPESRVALMQSAFGAAVVASGVFAAREMPAGATIVFDVNGDGNIYFVVHAPHAVQAYLILVDETSPGGASRNQLPMTLTNDTFYWWCSIPIAQAPAGTRYRFLLNDETEVLDPAARAVQDRGEPHQFLRR